VDFHDGVGSDRGAVEPAIVDPLLNGNMSLGFELEIALPGVPTVVALERALDIDGMGVVAFDQVV
jgi:hypothetical protein